MQVYASGMIEAIGMHAYRYQFSLTKGLFQKIEIPKEKIDWILETLWGVIPLELEGTERKLLNKNMRTITSRGGAECTLLQ